MYVHMHLYIQSYINSSKYIHTYIYIHNIVEEAPDPESYAVSSYDIVTALLGRLASIHSSRSTGKVRVSCLVLFSFLLVLYVAVLVTQSVYCIVLYCGLQCSRSGTASATGQDSVVHGRHRGQAAAPPIP